MSLQKLINSPSYLVAVLQPTSKRRGLLILSAAAFLLMAFYAVTDGAYADHDPLLLAADWSGYAFCHRLSDHSFTLSGRQFPLCARCTGMYLGAALVTLVFVLSGRGRRALLPRRNLFFALLALIALMGIDGINSYSHFFPNAPHLYEPRNWLRLVTGLGTGLTLSTVVCAALAQALWRQPQHLPIIENWRELGGLLMMSIVAAALVLSNQPALLYVLALLSSAGLLFVLTGLNTAVLLVLLRSDGQAGSWQQAARPLLAGFLLAILEIGTISTIRWTLTGTLTGLPGL